MTTAGITKTVAPTNLESCSRSMGASGNQHATVQGLQPGSGRMPRTVTLIG